MDSVRDIISLLRDFIESSGRLAIVCLGNELRGDDAVGKIVCEQLARLCGEKLYIVYAGQDAARVVGLALEGYNVLLVDAIVYGRGRIGDIVVAKVESLAKNNSLLPSTHTISIGEYTRYLKSRVLVVGVNVNPDNLGLGNKISKEVKEASHILVGLLANMLSCTSGAQKPESSTLERV